MGLLAKISRKEKAVEAQTSSPVPDDGGWRLWAAKGSEHLAKGDYIGAVEHWCQAIDRFDGSDKAFGGFCSDLEDKILDHIALQAGKGRFDSTHLMADLDLEISIKHPGFDVEPFVERVFYGMKEHLSEAVGPEMTVSLYTAAAYAVLGEMRYASVLDDIVERCQEASRLASVAAEQAGSYKRSSFKGNLKPSEGKKYLEGFVWYFDTFGDLLGKVASSSGEVLVKVTAKRSENPSDLIDPLSASLEYSCRLAGAGMMSRGKFENDCKFEMGKYVGMFLSDF